MVALRNLGGFLAVNMLAQQLLAARIFLFQQCLFQFSSKGRCLRGSWLFLYSRYQKQPFVDVLQSGVLKNFAIFTEKHLRWSPFLAKLEAFRPVILLKRDSSIGVFLYMLRNFKNTSLYRTPPVAASRYSAIQLPCKYYKRHRLGARCFPIKLLAVCMQGFW